ncbi:DUF6282 family protein [Micromonospora sp. LOL_015]|uniref:DUF6282 family protein n=1 Tax=Micromonospora sp. LOL_015 TaxID=3345416 RepID=UPI003A8C1F72
MCNDDLSPYETVPPASMISIGYPGPRPDFLTDAVDLHIHSGPDAIDRIGTSIDIARAAAAAGMKAIVLKDHLFPSYTKAVLTDQAVDGLRVFGGITMNGTAGGIAVRPVLAALAGGARVVMFPTFDGIRYVQKKKPGAIQLQHSFGQQITPILAVEDGKLLPHTEDVLQAVSDHPQVILSAGHLGPEEAIPIMRRAAELGIANKVIEHPNSSDWWSLDHYQQLVDCGTTFNMSYNPYQPIMGRRNFDELVELIGQVGAENCNLITDGGQPYNPMPAITMNVLCEMLYFQGVALDEIIAMAKTNPARMLGL